MHKTLIEHPEIKLVGLKIRTSFQTESNPETAKIGPLVGRYFSQNIADTIPHRKNPGVRIIGYSNYESDEYGAYDFYFGEEVSVIDQLPEGLSSLIIPEGKYMKITSSAGTAPMIYIETWQNIWEITRNRELGAKRTYQVDFEVHDQRANDPNNTIFDVCLGVEMI